MMQSQEEKARREADLTDRVIAEIRLKELQLHILLEITKAINQNQKTHQLLSNYERVLSDELKIGSIALFMLDTGKTDDAKRWRCALLHGADSSIRSIDVNTLLQPYKYVTALNDADPVLAGFSTVIPVIHKDQPLAYALIGDYSNEELNYNDDILPFVQIITNLIMVAIENKRFYKDQMKQAGVKMEMDLAAKMQTMLFPVQMIANENWELAATYLPHQEVGGDYYDYFLLNENELVLCIADVSGKGVSAALLMSNFQANLHALIKHFTTLQALAVELNECVTNSAKGEKFITFFIAKYHSQTHELTYINAGHPPPVIECNGKTELLQEGTTGLGMFDKLPFINTGFKKIEPNTTLLLYTDGVADAENVDKQQFGIERVQEFMQNNAGNVSSERLNEKLMQTLQEFNTRFAFNDDLSSLVCRFMPAAVGE